MTKTVLRYPGGKSRAVEHIVAKLPPSDVYVSPFFGGGAIELYLAGVLNKKVIANDKFEPLTNFWRCLKVDAARVHEEVLKLHPITKDMFIECRGIVCDMSICDFLRAAAYFALNRSSFSGATLSGGFSKEAAKKRFNRSAIDRLLGVNLCNIEFYNMDFKDFMSAYGNAGVVYLDPPYALEKGSNKLYGKNGDMHDAFDHEGLRDMLLGGQISKPWVMSYNNSDVIKEMYVMDGIGIEEATWSYGMNKSKKSSEILIMKT